MKEAAITTPAPSPRTRLRLVALPNEHGSWGLVLEPILLGLLVAPSWAGVLLAIAAFTAFLARHPLKIVRSDRLQQMGSRRAGVALRFAAGYLLVTCAAFAGALWLVAALLPFLPLLLALPFLAVFIAYDTTQQGRSWQAQLAAPTAFSAVAASVALAGGLSFGSALALWVVLVARAVPSILYVRERLRLARGQDTHPLGTIAAHVVAWLVVLVLTMWGMLPWLALAALSILLARAAGGLSRYRRPRSTKVIGLTEMSFGILTVVLTAAGFWFA